VKAGGRVAAVPYVNQAGLGYAELFDTSGNRIGIFRREPAPAE
jgi:hypothetical protein